MADRTAALAVDVEPAVQSAVPRPWRHLEHALPTARAWIVLAIVLTTFLIYWPSALALHGLWTDTHSRTYTHGYLILFISLWLIARSGEALDGAPVRPISYGLAAIIGLSAAWLLAWRAGLQDLHLVLLPLLMTAQILTVFGWTTTLRAGFPIGFLCFALPLWGDMVGILQRMSVAVTSGLIWCTGLPAFVEGNRVHVPAGVLEIEDGCAGLHYLIVGLALAALYGELLKDSIALRLRWLCFMGVLAIVGNWLRIFVIVIAAYVTDMQGFLIRVDHYWFGWLLFAAAFALFLRIAGRTARAPAGVRRALVEPPMKPAEQPGVTGTSLVRAPVVNPRWYVASVVCACALPLAVYASSLKGPSELGVAINWPSALAAWQGPLLETSATWSPEFHNATTTALRRYTSSSGLSVEMFVVAYRTQEQGRELVTYDNALFGTQDALSLEQERVVRAGGSPWRDATVVDRDSRKSIIWWQYRIGERSFTSPLASQLWYGMTALGAPQPSSLVALRTPCQSSCAAARRRLEAFVPNLEPTQHLISVVQGNPSP